MRFIKFTYTEKFGYLQKSSSDYAYGMLGDFFTDEISIESESFRNWILEPSSGSFSGNIVFIDRRRRYLRIHYDPIMDLSEEQIERIKRETGVTHVDEEVFISREDFIHILVQWIKCRRYHCDEIWVKKDNGVFWVEGVV